MININWHLLQKIRRYTFYLLLSIVQILSFMISIIAYKQIKNSRCRYCIKISDSDLGLISCIILFFLKLQTITKCFPIVKTYSNQSLSLIILFRFIFETWWQSFTKTIATRHHLFHVCPSYKIISLFIISLSISIFRLILKCNCSCSVILFGSSQWNHSLVDYIISSIGVTLDLATKHSLEQSTSFVFQSKDERRQYRWLPWLCFMQWSLAIP